MVAGNRRRKSLSLARKPALPALRPPDAARARLDGIEQRPVALFQRVALRERRAQLEPERAQHAVVAVVALQDDADERRSRSAAGGAELVRDRIAFARHRVRPAACRQGARDDRAPASTSAVSRPSVASMSAWIAGSSAPGTLYSSLAGTIIAATVRRSSRWAEVSSFAADMAVSIEEVGKALLHLVGDVERDRLDGRGRVHAA